MWAEQKRQEREKRCRVNGVRCMEDCSQCPHQRTGSVVSLDQLAEVFGISKYALLHEFKDYTGMPIYQYILARRVILAQQLLRQGAKPHEACEQSGFTNYPGFYRAFKARTGKSPNQYLKTLSD
jgi:AraC-like DNA-binding protein